MLHWKFCTFLHSPDFYDKPGIDFQAGYSCVGMFTSSLSSRRISKFRNSQVLSSSLLTDSLMFRNLKVSQNHFEKQEINPSPSLVPCIEHFMHYQNLQTQNICINKIKKKNIFVSQFDVNLVLFLFQSTVFAICTLPDQIFS